MASFFDQDDSQEPQLDSGLRKKSVFRKVHYSYTAKRVNSGCGKKIEEKRK